MKQSKGKKPAKDKKKPSKWLHGAVSVEGVPIPTASDTGATAAHEPAEPLPTEADGLAASETQAAVIGTDKTEVSEELQAEAAGTAVVESSNSASEAADAGATKAEEPVSKDTDPETAEIGESVPAVPPRSRQRRKLYLLVAGGVAGVLVVTWMLCSLFLMQVQISGSQVAARSSDQALSAAIQKQAQAYQLTVQYPDGAKKHYPFSQLGLKVDREASVKATRERQHRLANWVHWWQPVPAAVVVKADQAKLNEFIATSANVTVQPSKDAVLTIIKGEIQVTEAVVGKQYGLSKPEHTILAAATDLKRNTVTLKTLAVKPALTAQALEDDKALLEKALHQPISFTIGGRTVAPSPADIAEWLEITPDEKSKKVDIEVNSGKVLAYINAIAARDIHPPRAQIETKQPDGSTKVLITGLNGVDVPDKSKVATTVAKSLLDGSGITQTLTISNQPYQTVATASYDKWIEVDLTNKRMYAYEKDTLVKTDLVTAGAPGTPTVTGQFAIYSKRAQQDMRGNNVDGSRYFQPNVKWVNYFHRDYAIHGNYWRPLSYFGNINSSHGCVSLVEAEAAWMYNWAPIGTPVIVHS